MNDTPKKSLALSSMLKEKLIQRSLAKRPLLDDEVGVPIKKAEVNQRYQKILPEWYSFKHHSGYQQIQLQKAAGKELGISNPFFRVQSGIAGENCEIDGQHYWNFASYNYLNFNGHPQVSAAAKAAIDEYGTSVSASRLVSGERLIHRQLEQALAAWHGVEDCVVFVSGHATNVSTIGYLFGINDLVLYDAFSHNSIVQGAILSSAQRRVFPHNDWQTVEKILAEERLNYQRVLIVIEGIYSMDGDMPDLAEFIRIKQHYQAILMVDEAHSLGVLGDRGQGLAAHCGVNPKDIDICMGTLSKTLAAAGGYIAGESALIELLRSYAPGFLYSVGISPPVAAAALAALTLLQQHPERVAQLHENGNLFLQTARSHGINTGLSQGYSVIPVIVGSSIKAGRLAQAMFNRGINVQPIFYPAVEEKSARLRFFISCAHSQDQIIETVKILAEELAKI
ncbi:MAG: polyketide synthase [Pseudomonadota bacterium]|jgi:8-amino-7-oxononanoate synthase